MIGRRPLLAGLALPVAEHEAGCGTVERAFPMAWRNPRFGLGMTYPSSFRLDPDSIPASGDTTRFATADGQATVVVTALGNGLRQTLPALFAEARRDILENSGGVITYQRTQDNWFVLSGYMAGRIFYRRSLLTAGSAVIGTLWIEFPRGMRSCYEAAVAMMSLSFRETRP